VTKVPALLAFLVASALAGVMVAVLVTPAVALSGVAARSAIGAFEDLPGDLAIVPLDQRTKVYAKSHGKDVLLASFFTQDREVVPWSAVPTTVKDAAIAGEDVRFYHHGGVDPNAIIRAAVADLLGQNLQGASTITQQYVKNVCVQQAEALSTAAKRTAAYEQCVDPSVGRKVHEMRLAIGLEKKYSKNQILLGYLNIAGFGGRVYGIESAAGYYFGKRAKDLSIGEAAALLAIVNNPEHFRLDRAANVPVDRVRRDHILAVELKEHMISSAEYRQAVAADIKPRITPPKTGCDAAGVAGFFCDYVVNTILTDKTYGATRAERSAALQRKGWRIHTTLNLDLQRTAQTVMNRYVPMKSSAFDVGGAAVSMEVGTGRVVTMVQNKHYNASGAGIGAQYSAVNYNVSEALGAGGGPQPGSTFKLFPLLNWLEKGHTLTQTVNGNPRTIPAGDFAKCGRPDTDDKPWSVGNDEPGERGNYSVLAGTARSVNGVFASIGEEGDLCRVRQLAESMGAKNARGGPLSVVPAMLIGGASSVAPLGMANAYATIANHGVTCDPRPIDGITDSSGAPVPVPPRHCRRTVSAPIATAAAYALRRVITGGTMAGDQTPDGLYEIGKTGTTDEAKDTWAIGTTSKVTTAVWIGNANGFQNLRKVYGFPYCPLSGSTQAAIERHCVWKGIQTAVNRVYGGATGWATPESRYLYGGAPITSADARPRFVYQPPPPPTSPAPAPQPQPKPKPTPKPTPSKSTEKPKPDPKPKH
jgi:membrane peptidoglycan carboxypeptidase